MSINGQAVLGIIPARGGSKRVPRKNLRWFRDEPLFYWTAAAAEKSRYIDLLVVSTEDAEIKELAQALMLEVLDRPAELATDEASSEDVIRHALTIHKADWVVLLQLTSPLRLAEDIDACIERAQMGYGCISINRATGEHNGAVYVARPEWLAHHDFSHMGLMKYLMPEERSLDLNTEEDFGA